MKFKTRTFCVALATAVLFPTSIFAAGGSTPEEVFNNFKTAMKDKDYKAGFGQLTPESQDILLASRALNINLTFGADPSKGPEVQAMMDKHGIKKIDTTALQTSQNAKALITDSVAGVKDKGTCFADLMTWMEKNSAEKNRSEKMEAYSHAELADVKTTGDSAVGNVKVKLNGAEDSSPMMFKKIGGKWFIDFASLGGSRGRAAAPGK